MKKILFGLVGICAAPFYMVTVFLSFPVLLLLLAWQGVTEFGEQLVKFFHRVKETE